MVSLPTLHGYALRFLLLLSLRSKELTQSSPRAHPELSELSELSESLLSSFAKKSACSTSYRTSPPSLSLSLSLLFRSFFFLLYDAELIIHQLSQHGITPVRSDRSHCKVSLNYNSSTASLPSSFLPPAKLFFHWLQALCLDNPPSLTKDPPIPLHRIFNEYT